MVQLDTGRRQEERKELEGSQKRKKKLEIFTPQSSIKRKGCEKRSTLKISDAEAMFPVPVIEEFVIINKLIFPSKSCL
jgi:hypothetical protein